MRRVTLDRLVALGSHRELDGLDLLLQLLPHIHLFLLIEQAHSSSTPCVQFMLNNATGIHRHFALPASCYKAPHQLPFKQRAHGMVPCTTGYSSTRRSGGYMNARWREKVVYYYMRKLKPARLVDRSATFVPANPPIVWQPASSCFATPKSASRTSPPACRLLQ